MNFRIDPKKQFSKRLAKWTAFFWFFYMIWLSVVMWLEPQAAQYGFYMGLLTTIVMVVNVFTYTHNSVAEKMAFALLDKTKLEISLGNSGKRSGTNSAEEEEGDEDG